MILLTISAPESSMFTSAKTKEHAYRFSMLLPNHPMTNSPKTSLQIYCLEHVLGI